MGNTSRSSDLSASRRAELEIRFREIDALIVRQKQALQEVRNSGAIFVAAAQDSWLKVAQSYRDLAKQT